MKKSILALAILTVSFSSFASEITCKGQTTKAAMVLELTGRAFPLNRADYSFNNKVIESSGYEFGINSNNDEGTQKLTYKFLTLKKHALAKKKSNLLLTIKQKVNKPDAFVFELQADHEAELALLEEGSSKVVLDKLTCTTK